MEKKSIFVESIERITKEYNEAKQYHENLTTTQLWVNGFIQGLVKAKVLTSEEIGCLLFLSHSLKSF